MVINEPLQKIVTFLNDTKTQLRDHKVCYRNFKNKVEVEGSSDNVQSVQQEIARKLKLKIKLVARRYKKIMLKKYVRS